LVVAIAQEGKSACALQILRVYFIRPRLLF
jgi:hypothetical protein